MKRLFSLLIVLAMLTMVVPFSAFAAGASYSIELDAPEVFKAGDEVTVVATVKNISVSGGISGVHFLLSYDQSALEVRTYGGKVALSAFKSSEFENWEDFSKVDTVLEGGKFVPANNGILILDACDTDGKNNVGGSGSELVFEIVFTAKSDANSDVSFSVDASESECIVFDNNDKTSKGTVYPGIADDVEETVVYNENAYKGHNPGPAATCTEDQVCLGCGELIEKASGHNYKDKVVDPTCDEQGYTEHTCDCGDYYKDNYKDPSHTPGEWVEEGDKEILYCGVCGDPIDERDIGVDVPEYVLGDVDNDGEITADDYILLKRIFFGTAKLNTADPTAFLRSDVDKDGEITADDYILLKRVFFGTAKI